MSIKPIRSDGDHAKALATAASLMTRTDQTSLDELDVLQVLIERWEAAQYHIDAPTPVQAIAFRMQQLGLKQRDLAPYLGSKSRVSEIMAGHRQLTIDQVRALHLHLGIPAASLIGASRHEPAAQPTSASKSAIDKLRTFGVLKASETLEAFTRRAAAAQPAMAMLRKTRTDRTNAKTDLAALEAWCGAVLLKAHGKRLPKEVKTDRSPEAARTLAKLSREPNGPALVETALASMGVILIVLDHLPGTFLDGAAFCRGDDVPVIALTLRHDRLDNFWFTLLHEFAHVCRHLGQGVSIIVDDLDVKSSDAMEEEADEFARDALIPRTIWERLSSPMLATAGLEAIATEAGVSPAVVAGRWRWEHHDYRRFSRLVGRGELRPHFE